MALQTNKQDVIVMADPLSFTAEIRILRGNPVQTLNRESGEYEPDRSVLPCVILPFVAVSDPENIMKGEIPIAGCQWYEGAPKADSSNLIRTGDDYELSAPDEPVWSLKVKRNFDQAHPCDIYAVFSFIDTRRGSEVKVERSLSFRTAYYDLEQLSLKINQPEGWKINPLEMNQPNGPWLHTITAQLFSGKEKVSADHAAYFWQKMENGSWTDISADDREIWCDGYKGVWGQSITFDARFFKKMAFRCRAAYYSGQRPSVPAESSLVAETHIKVDMPQSLKAEISKTKGAKVDGTMRTPVGFRCDISDKNGFIPTSHSVLFSINWMARSGRAGSAPYDIGKGRSIEIIPADVGMDRVYSNEVQAEVKIFHTAALLTFGGKAIAVNNIALTTYNFE